MNSDGTGLFRVIVQRVDGDPANIWRGYEHVADIRIGSWVSALTMVTNNITLFKYIERPGMSAEDYIRGLADKDLQAELNRRNKIRDDAEKREREERWRKMREQQDRENQEAADRIGITVEQLEEVFSYHYNWIEKWG